MEHKKHKESSLQNMERRRNLFSVMTYCLQNDGCSKREICEGTNLSWGLVSKVTNDLEKRGFLKASSHERLPGAGRNAFGYCASEERYVSLGVSVEKNRFVLSVVSLRKNILKRIVLEKELSSKEEVFAALFSIIDDAAAWSKEEGKEVLSIGLSVQSYVNSKKGQILHFPGINENEWKDVDVVSPLKEKYHVPVFMERDGVCLLCEEYIDHGAEDKILVLLDNSISFGVFFDGSIVSGSNSMDLGHTVYDLNLDPKEATLTSLVSVKGLLNKLQISEKELFENPGKYASTLKRAGQYLGLALYDVYRLQGISNIVLAGKLLLLKDFFLEEAKKTMKRYMKNEAFEGLRFTFLDSNDGSRGAAWFALQSGLEESIGRR